MTCADFTAMDAAKQAETVSMISEERRGDRRDGSGTMAEGDMMAPEDTAMAVGERLHRSSRT